MPDHAFHRVFPFFKLLGLSALLGVSMSSCVPLAIGAVGLAAGYIARDEGFGQAKPLDGGYDSPAAYEEPAGGYDSSQYQDAPVY
ncbi:hypothetical protein ACFSSA_03190 [Luteolibacter algae]|uniref:Uncharacterized protein n=1 Tax=Luteolibacter algae TaxID=454151 RepID=A0ABW5D5G7_9BACT